MNVPNSGYILLCLVLFLTGACAGRFLNRCVLRLCQHFEVLPAWRHVFARETRKGMYPPTHWYHCLPIIGTATLVGRSPYSGRRILKREPWLEVLNGLLFVLTFLCTIPPQAWGGPASATVTSLLGAGDLYDWNSPSLLFLWGRYLYFLTLVEALFVATFIDFDLWIIPDGVTVPAMGIGFMGQILGAGFFLAPVWFQDPELLQVARQVLPLLIYWPVNGWIPEWISHHPYWHAAAVAVAGFIVGGGIVWTVRIIGGLILRREAMGFGDVILMAMIGLFIGWQASVLVFFLAPVMALLVLFLISLLRFFSLVKLPPALPYGPYLSLATLVVLFGWNVIWPAFIRLFLMGPLLILLAGLMTLVLAGTLLLLQGLKWLMGIPVWDQSEYNWRAADQLLYQMGEARDPQQGNWRRARWSGIPAGQGQIHELHWRQRCP